MNDSQAWAAEQFSTSKSKERGMGKVSYKSAEDLNKEVWSYPTGDGVRLLAKGYNGIGVAILLANRDACELGKHLIEFAENNLSIDEQPQPRRPDEVGVIGDLPSEEPAWPLNGEWGDRGQPPTCEGVFDADSIWDGGTLTVVRHGDQLYAGTAGVSGPLWGIDDPQFKATKWRYLRPLDEPQEAKPQLIDAVEELASATRHIATELRNQIARWGSDAPHLDKACESIVAAEVMLRRLRNSSS